MPTGLTQDAGWEIGVSKTLPLPADRLWTFLAGPEGLALWLGDDVELGRTKGTPYRTAAGTVGEIRSFHEGERCRLTWRPAGWTHDTTLQVTVRPVGPDRARIGFHQEWLSDADERERQREHWQGVVAALESALGVD